MSSLIRTIEIDSEYYDDDSNDVPDSEELLARSTASRVDNSHNSLTDEITALDDKMEEMFRTCTSNKAELKALNMLQKAAEKRHATSLTDYGKMVKQKQRLEAQLLKQKHEAAVIKKENSVRKTLKRTRNRSLKSETSGYSGSDSGVFLPQNAVKAIRSMPPPSPLKPYKSMPPPGSVKTNKSMPPPSSVKTIKSIPSSTPAKTIKPMLLESAVKASRPIPTPSPATVKATKSIPPSTPSKAIKSIPTRSVAKAARSTPSLAQAKTNRSTPFPIEVQIKPMIRPFRREEYTRLSESPPAKRIKHQQFNKKPTPPKATYAQVIAEINGDDDYEESHTSAGTKRFRLGRPKIIAKQPFDGKIGSGSSLARNAL